MCLSGFIGSGTLVLAAQQVTVTAARVVDSAVNSASLNDHVTAQGADIETVAASWPNLHVSAGGVGAFGNLLSARGLANTPYFSEPAVGMYLGDIPLTAGYTYPVEVFPFNEVQWLSGPSVGRLGRAASAGTIVLKTAADNNDSIMDLSLKAAERGTRSAALNLQQLAWGSFVGSLALAANERDGYVRNVQLNQDVDALETRLAAVQINGALTDTVKLAAQIHHHRHRGGAQAFVPLGGSFRTVERDQEGETAVDFTGFALRFDINTDSGVLSSITSHTDWDLSPYTNQLLLPTGSTPLALNADLEQRHKAWNQELRWSSGEGNGPWSWTTGLWSSFEQAEGIVDRSIAGLFSIEASQFDLDSAAVALFGSGTWSWRENWQLASGLRIENTDKRFSRDATVPVVESYSDRESFLAVSPEVALHYQLQPSLHTSLRLAGASRPGGWSSYTSNRDLAPFDAERLRTVEFELAGNSHDSNFAWSAQLFYQWIRDLQIERSFTASDYLVVNAPRAAGPGAQLQFSWQPQQYWNIDAAVGYVDLRLREFVDPFTADNFRDSVAPNAPRYDARLALRYARNEWFARGEVNWVGKTYFDEANNDAVAQTARETINLQGGYRRNAWQTSIYVTNLTDKKYYSLISPGIVHGIPGAPRLIGFELKTSL
jgi:iron complex outermembrane recepter protein